MVYVNWSKQEQFIDTFQWITLSDFINYLHTVTDFIINIPDKRYGQQHVPKLTYATLPIEETERFPEFEAYLCSGYGKWKTELDLLQLSISVIVNKNRISRQYPYYSTEGKAEIYAISKVHHLLQLVQEEYLQRLSFEHHLELNWEEEEK